MAKLIKSIVSTGLAVALTMSSGFVTLPAAAQQATAPDPAAVTALIARLRASLDGQAANATSATIQAGLAFTADQAQQPREVLIAALTGLDTSDRSSSAKSAVAALLKRIKAGEALAGTGGVGGVGAVSALAAGPTVGGGGAASDYTATQ